jgi:pilus assembly protein TadC
VSLATRLYERPTVVRFLATWLVGITAGVLVRALILGRHLGSKEAAFLAVSLVFTLLFVLAARALVSTAERRRRA